MEMIDTTNIQDVFATTSVLENVGGGCTRIYNCVAKNGLLVPVGYSIVFPSPMLLRAAIAAEEFSRRLALTDMVDLMVH